MSKRSGRRGTGAIVRGLAAGICCIFLLSSEGPDYNASQILRVTTRLVEVNIVAHDKRGEAVRGLGKGDFTILDNGKPQQISVFSTESGQASPASSRFLPANVFSNRVARTGDIPANAVAILLDGAETSFADSVIVRNAIIKFLRGMSAGDRVALYALARRGRLSVIRDFTSDPSPLVQALRNHRGSSGVESVAPSQRDDFDGPRMTEKDVAARLDSGMNDSPTSTRVDYPPMSPGFAVREIAYHLSGLPGRKSLIWITDTVPHPGPLYFENPGAVLGYEGNLSREERAIQELVRILNQADVAVYPVDAHGLVVGPAKIGVVHGPDLAPLWPGEVWTLYMDYWAQQTGGKAFYYTNDIGGSIRRALEDTKAVYTLGYYPADTAWDGLYHHIRVLVDRQDVELRYRRGYLATGATAHALNDPGSMLEAAADSPLDSTALGVRVRLTPAGDFPLDPLKAAVYVDASGLTFEQQNGQYDASLMIWAGEYSRRGELLKVKTKKLSFKLKEADYKKVLGGGLGVNIQEDADAKASELRVAVLDLNSLATGSVRINLARVTRR